MTTWQEHRFSDVLVDGNISYGIVQPGSHTEVDSVPIVRVNNIKNGKIQTDDVLKVASSIEEKYQRTRLQGGELLITVVGSVGECAIVPDSLKGWNVARAVSVARISDDFDKRYIKYCFKSEDLIFQMYGNTNDTVQPTLNLSSLKSLVLSIPPLPEQKAISAVLSSLDDKIDLLHRQNKTLEAMAASLFRQWFVEEAHEDWAEYSFGDFATHLKGNVVPSKTPNKIFHHYSLPAFDAGMRPTVEAGSEILSNKYAVKPWTILVSKLNPRFPRIWPIGDLTESDAICSTEFQVFTPKSENLFGYIYFFLRSDDAKDELTMAASGTSGSHQRVRPEDILSIKTNLPSMDLAVQYSVLVMPNIRKMWANNEQIQSLEKLRDTLLPKLMSGEVRVQSNNSEASR